MAPMQVLLLDEVTVDLDVLARSSLMAFLRRECRERQATVVYVSGVRVVGEGRACVGVHLSLLAQAALHVFGMPGRL